jgi:Fungal N-terminal domain of STAND proteins
MDPASAAVAFVGFAASLATLTGLVIDSAKAVNKLCNSLKRAPAELKRFLATLKQLESIVSVLKDKTSNYTDEELPVLLKQFWLENVSQMKEDYDGLAKLVGKLQSSFGARSISNKHVRGRLRTFFSLDEISEFENRLSRYIGKFDLALSLIKELISPAFHPSGPC